MENKVLLEKYLGLSDENRFKFLKAFFLNDTKSEKAKAALFKNIANNEKHPKIRTAAEKLLRNIEVNIVSIKTEERIDEIDFIDFNSKDPSILIASIKNITRKKDFSFLDKIEELAESDKSPKVRYYAKKALPYLKKYKNDKILSEKSAKKDAETAIKSEAEKFAMILKAGSLEDKIEGIKKAAKNHKTDFLPLIIEHLKTEKEVKTLSAFISSIGYLGDETHINVLKDYCNHENYRIVANTVEALGKIGSEKILPFVTPLLNSDDNRVKANALLTFERIDPDKCIKTIEEMMMSGKVEMQASALYCIDTLGQDEALKLLELGLEGPSEIVDKTNKYS